MLVKKIKTASHKSSVQALDHALKKAVSLAKGSPHTDIMVTELTQTADGWQSILDIISEPKHKKSDLLEFDFNARILEEKAHKEKEDEEKEEKKRLEEYHHQLDDYGHELIVRAHEREDVMMHIEQEIINLYAEVIIEELIMEAAPKYEFTSIHFLPHGSLWDAAQNRHPDLQLYEAAREDQPHGNVFDAVFSNPQRKPKPGRSSVLSPELTDE